LTVAAVAQPVSSLEADLARISLIADRAIAGVPHLAAELGELYKAIVSMSLAGRSVDDVKRSAPAVIRGLFDMRMRIADKIPDWHAQGLVTHEVQKAMRDAFRAARYGAELLGEVLADNVRLGSGDPAFAGFTGGELSTLVAPQFRHEGLTFRTGDVLLVRGRLHNSAAIARIGDIDSQFSHAALLYVEPDGTKWVVEALIEDGVTINKLDSALTHGIGRAALYRHNNPERAAAAAAMICSHVRKAKLGKIPRIPYDFTMLLDGYKQLFCSKLVRQAYDLGSAGTLMLPTYKTRLEMRNSDFFKRIGVKAVETFAPGDIEIEPSFDLVAEWQDFRATANLRLQDMIMTKFFEWMDTHNYKFHEDMLIVLIGILGRFSSGFSDRLKDLLSGVVPKVPDNMGRRTIQTIAMLHKTAEQVLEKLSAADRANIATSGFPLHPRAVFAALEQMRENGHGQIGYLSGRRIRVPGLRRSPQAAPEI